MLVQYPPVSFHFKKFMFFKHVAVSLIISRVRELKK